MLVNNLTLLEMRTEIQDRAEEAAQKSGKKLTAGIKAMAQAVGVDYSTMKGFALGTIKNPSELTVDRVRAYLRDDVVGDSALEEELDRRKDEQKKIEEWWAARFQDVNDELQMMKQSRFANCHEVSHLADHLSADELAELVFTTAHMFKFGMVDEDEEPEGKVLNPLEIDSGEDGRPLICTERGRVVVIVRHSPCPACE